MRFGRENLLAESALDLANAAFVMLACSLMVLTVDAVAERAGYDFDPEQYMSWTLMGGVYFTLSAALMVFRAMRQSRP